MGPTCTTGYSTSGGGQVFTTLAYDAVTGEQVWATSSLQDHVNALPHALSVQPSGGHVVVAGESYSFSTGQDFTTLAYQG
jgi:hypothetical protein